jgi:hypothetical protein
MSGFRKFGFAGIVVKPYKINDLSETMPAVLSMRSV